MRKQFKYLGFNDMGKTTTSKQYKCSIKRYLVKCTDYKGEREGVFNAQTTKQAYKQAKRHLHIYGDAEYSFTIID